jgi:hypothetical protein
MNINQLRSVIAYITTKKAPDGCALSYYLPDVLDKARQALESGDGSPEWLAVESDSWIRTNFTRILGTA